ncbi:DUF3488 and transglutaminase-like domain-containing protein [Paucibacter sp. APW11]|uniref:DUF3488 and transglutaminase-like domain-containing protein n=1 Tax=Roseateles aquae TaxID=3077235 RepID=A0ABU3P943_9BURK|nr:DUF3488 and transglutaminase-like domain-containing protein [Paucibacter sp. APW11]MDT8999074.1 DUF3488 and transglutaminase-like domain-containing protein [Paucibacter sp. APW11]
MRLPLLSALARLPREARDTLFLLAALAATALPHISHLPLWCSALTAAVLLWRGRLAWRGAPLPGRRSLLLVLLLTLVAGWASHRSLFGREAGITLLVVLMALKTLELHARRDAFVVFFLGFFLVLTQYFYSQSLLTALWSLACVWALLSALVLAQMPVGQPHLALAARQALRTTLWGLPIMVLLFLLFPRIGPLWGLPSDAIGRTGLSDKLQFGAMSEIANDDSIALRLRFEGARPPGAQLYLRGPVLSQFDGKTWLPRSDKGTAIGMPEAARLAVKPEGEPLRYEMTLEPLRLPLLPVLELGAEAPGSPLQIDELTLTRDRELVWQADRPITERLRLRQRAWLQSSSGVGARPGDLAPYLQLPAGLNPRLLDWARTLRDTKFSGDQQAGAEQLAGALLDHIRHGDFIYTLAPGRYGEVTPHALDEFWFDRRLGFCEHYASAFVIAMRAMGVPSRLVSGFQGADAELQDGDVVVRQSQAHAWAEYWAPGLGWRRADPTAAVAPERVLRGQVLRPPPGLLAGALGQVDPQLWTRLRGAWETLDHRWQQWVLNYSRGDQFRLLEQLGWQQADWQALGQASAAVIAALASAAALWSAWSSRPHDDWSRQRAFIVRRLRRLGLPAEPHQGPRQWTEMLRLQYGDRAAALAALLLALDAERYGPAAAPAPRWGWGWRWRRMFRQALRQARTPD